jgi:hypothetical protein
MGWAGMGRWSEWRSKREEQSGKRMGLRGRVAASPSPLCRSCSPHRCRTIVITPVPPPPVCICVRYLMMRTVAGLVLATGYVTE